MPRSIARFALLAVFCAGLLSATNVSHAQVATPQLATPDLLRARAQQSLVGPSLRLSGGLLLMLAAPVASISLAFASYDWSDDDESQSSSNNGDTAMAISLGVGMTAVGSALTAWGMTDVIRIRSARRRLAHMESPALAVGRGAAQLTWRFRF
jgi:hypothetical protein